MQEIIKKIKESQKPLILGAGVGLFIGVYGTSYYYQSEFAKLSAFTNILGLNGNFNRDGGSKDEKCEEGLESLGESIKKLSIAVEKRADVLEGELSIIVKMQEEELRQLEEIARASNEAEVDNIIINKEEDNEE
jgi:hypothetical protein